ncbi:MAG: phosphoenolpyruvate--protein phosphotransferase [Oscillospiraceae bacterium]
MIQLTGRSVCDGIVIGTLAFYKSGENRNVTKHTVKNVDTEIVRFEQAKSTACTQLKALYEKALNEVGEANAQIFDIHQMMLEDLDYCESILGIIKMQQANAEYAVSQTSENFAQIFSTMDGVYMQARAADVKDISGRLLDVLLQTENVAFPTGHPVIVFAEDLAPSQTIQMDKSLVLGFLTMQGSTNSHTAILARTLNIPAVVSIGTQLTKDMDGKMVIINGSTGIIYIDPNEQTMTIMKEKQQQEQEGRTLLRELRGQPNRTLDGTTIKLFANIGNVADMALALDNDAGGIGLFRSEFLYLENKDYPTEDQQFEVYRTVVETMAGKQVVVRTLDIGADKQVDYFHLPKEENPAMGYRAIRICLMQPEIFITQLRALFRASAHGNLAILFPMITSVQEVHEIKMIVEQVKVDLRSEGIAFDENVQLGIMIETPAAALISDSLASEVDFFSVGTNDLTQYTLAIDRQNQNLERFYNPHHPAVLRLIQMAADAAHAHGKWIGICGELGADPTLTQTFLAMGIDELSVSPGAILGLRKQIRETDLRKVITFI